MKNKEKKKKASKIKEKKSGEILKFLSFFTFSSTVLASSFQPAFSDSFLYFPRIDVQSCIFQSVGYYPPPPKKKRRGGIRGLQVCRSGRSLSPLVCSHLVEFFSARAPQRLEDLLLEPQALPLLMLDPNPNCMFLVMVLMVSIRPRYWFQTKKIIKKKPKKALFAV